ncbi:acyl-CoA carboxylase subunit epsilon [Streptomyces sp. B-S-A8]|uniref:Acyl-CoA carboxylase subunit epsilon n=1 Tax=Streptomyces solicavernae TaxID=3043614 RepID=A0ABT6S0Z8_9ACTN|nr:acyl-CoA carboxylase subunit epsilon [Streptomyces sp. B-S-A8]MDI3390363.1 acyl-CoA carboxylase subunit epsilon [Streptomyces sp. B-S-A8]
MTSTTGTTTPATDAVDAPGPETFLRIERGTPDACELAALTAVLLSRVTALTDAGEDTEEDCPRTARWRRLERRNVPSTPRSWRTDAGR